MTRFEHPKRSAGRLVMALTVMLVVSACVQASATTPSPDPRAGVATPTAAVAATQSAAPTLEATVEPTIEPTPTATPVPTPIPDSVLLENPPAAPAAAWTSLRWLEVPAAHMPSVSSAIRYGYPNVQLDGWSRGYVEFVFDPWHFTVQPWASGNGVAWTKGAKLDTSVGWGADALSKGEIDESAGPQCQFTQTAFVEGPQGLMMQGYVSCGGGCGPGEYAVTPLGTWVSPDGRNWRAVDTRRLFGADVASLSGGSAGFVVLTQTMDDARNVTSQLWTSKDGSNWRSASLPRELLASTSTTGYPASFSGGYVVPGVLLVVDGHEIVGGCAVAWDPSWKHAAHRPAVWWSADGASWSRGSLPGALDAEIVTMTVDRYDDQLLIARANSQTWVSTDGKAWSPTSAGITDILDGGSRGLLCSFGNAGRGTTFATLAADGSSEQIAQTGSVPPSSDSITYALGPTGLIATDDGKQYWLAIPSAK